MQFNKEPTPLIGRETFLRILNGMSFGMRGESSMPEFMGDMLNQTIVLVLNRNW